MTMERLTPSRAASPFPNSVCGGQFRSIIIGRLKAKEASRSHTTVIPL